MDSPRETCFCGRKTTKSHDFLFCSTKCARQDSLRSLGDQSSHYRNVVRDAYVHAGAPGLHPVASRPRGPPLSIPPTTLAQDYRTLKCIAPWVEPPHCGNDLTSMATGELSRRQDLSNAPTRVHHATPFYDRVQNRYDPSSIDGPKETKKSPVAALLNFGRSRKGKEVENSERVLGHPTNTVAPPVRNDPRRMGRTL